MSAFDSFVKANLRGVASGMGISYNNLADDLESVNYSSLRQAALDERDQFQRFGLGSSITFRFGFRMWLESVLLNGSIGLPAARFAKFNAGIPTASLVVGRSAKGHFRASDRARAV